MGIDLRVTIDLDPAVKRLLRLEGRAADLREWFAERLSPRVTTMLSKQFATRGAWAGSRWPPLAEATAEKKARLGLDPRPLVATGAMMASFAGAEGAWERLGPAMYERGTRVENERGQEYYHFHHFGTVNEPERQVVPDPVPDAEVRAWTLDLERWLNP